MDWHRRMGMILVGLLAFRIVWGLIGPQTARFGSWRIGPAAILGYIRNLRSGVHKPNERHLIAVQICQDRDGTTQCNLRHRVRVQGSGGNATQPQREVHCVTQPGAGWWRRGRRLCHAHAVVELTGAVSLPLE